MNTLLSMVSAAILLMVSLSASANSGTEEDQPQPLQHQADTHQGHITHQTEADNSSDASPATNRPRLRNVTHPKTGHVTQRYVGQ